MRVHNAMTGEYWIRRIVLGPLQVNTYLVAGAGGDCIVVDPGDCSMVEEVERAGCERVIVAVTHGHFDHTQGVDCLVGAGARLAAHPQEPRVARASVELARLIGIAASVQESEPDIVLYDGGVFEAAGLRLEVLHTPGHSPDHIVLYDRAAGVAFTGDLVFKGSIGRVDIPGSDPRAMVDSLMRVVSVVDPGTRLLPGHGPETHMGYELEYNPFLRDPSIVLQ